MSRAALVVGGTGPTGPAVVEGLLRRGYEVTLFHSGAHEVRMPEEVRHLHGDAHFPETIAAALQGRSWDVALVQYGRLVHLAEALAGRVGHVVAIGGANRILKGDDDPAWGPAGRPALVDDSVFTDPDRWFEDDPTRNRFGVKMHEAHRRLFAVAAGGGYDATYIAYPILYGPRQPGCREWSVVRRILDGRRRLVVADGGLKIQTTGYTENVAAAPLLALDRRDVATGGTYFVSGLEQLTYRQRIELIARHLGAEVELVSLPWELATACHALYGAEAGHRAIACRRVVADLGYGERHAVDESIGRTVDWLRGLDAAAVEELEGQLGDPFDYAREDALLERWSAAAGELRAAAPPAVGLAHPYRHPTAVGEGWTRREFRSA